MAGLGQAPFDMPIFALLGLALGIWAVQGVHGRARFWQGWVLGLGYFALTLNWITEPFMVDVAATGWMAIPALIMMAGGLALFWGVAFRITPAAYGMAIGVTWTGLEFIRAYIFTGFPWGMIGYVWIDTPVYQAAAYIGPHGMTLFTILCAFVIARGPVVVGACVLVLALVFQMQSSPSPSPSPASASAPDAAIARLIHPNVAQADKWHPDKREGIYQNQLALTQAQPPVDLIIWPETSVYLPMTDAQSEIAAASNGAHVLVGAQRRSDENLYYNSLYVLSPAGNIDATYDKTRLVPFGEYVPLGEYARRFGIYGLAAQDGAWFATGPGPTLLDVAGIGKIQPLICYEGIFPQFVGATRVRPDLLVLITNDAWFGNFSGPAQHLAQARARSIELGVPMLRVANRGVSAVIDGHGTLVNMMGITARGFVDAPIPPVLAPTLYSKYRDIPALFFGVIVLLGAILWPTRF